MSDLFRPGREASLKPAVSRRFIRASVLASTLLVAALTGAAAHDYKAGAIEIVHPWARATPGGASVGGGYVELKNTGATPDRLVAVTAPFAGRVEIHEMAMTDGVMTMRPLPDGLALPPGGTVVLKPGSYHIMFMGLKAPLTKGEMVDGTLTFEKAGTVPVKFKVEGIAAGAPDHSSQGH